MENELSTKISLIEKIANWTGINKGFHRYTKDAINYDSNLIVSPVEATLIKAGKIKNNGKIISKSKKEIDLEDTIGKPANLFLGGFYFNFYLSPRNKHYWRIPYNSKLISTKINNGKARIPVFIGLERLFKKRDFFEKAMRKNASIGLVFQTENFPFAMIVVGSLNVNGIHIINKENKKYKKGDIGGYFNIGSSMLLCFPKYPLNSLIDIGTKINIGNPIIKI